MSIRAADILSYLLPPLEYGACKENESSSYILAQGIEWRVAGRTIAMYRRGQRAPLAKVKIGGTYPLKPLDVEYPYVFGGHGYYHPKGTMRAWVSDPDDLAVLVYADGGCIITTGKRQWLSWHKEPAPGEVGISDVDGIWRSSDTEVFSMSGCAEEAGRLFISPDHPLILSCVARPERVPVRDLLQLTSWFGPAPYQKGILPDTEDVLAMKEAGFGRFILMHHGCMQKDIGGREDGMKPPWVPNDINEARRLCGDITAGGCVLFPYGSAHYQMAFEKEGKSYLERVEESIAAFGDQSRVIYNDGWPCRDSGLKRDIYYEYHQSRLLRFRGIRFVHHGTMAGAWPFWSAAVHADIWIAGESRYWDVETMLHRARSPVGPWIWQCINKRDHAPELDATASILAAVRSGGSVMCPAYQEVRKNAAGNLHAHWRNGMTEWYKDVLAERGQSQLKV